MKIILDDRHLRFGGHSQKLPPPLQAHRRPRRVLEGRHHIETFGGVSMDKPLEQVTPDTILADRDGQDLGLVGPEDLQRARIGGALHYHLIAGIQEGSSDQIEALLRGLPPLYCHILDLRLQGHGASEVALQRPDK